MGMQTQNNLDSIMKSLIDTGLGHRTSMKGTHDGNQVTQKMIDEDLDERRTSLKQVRMQMQIKLEEEEEELDDLWK